MYRFLDRAMDNRLDIIIFGATGFTGKHTIPEVHRLSQTPGRKLTWGIAGRAENKLKQLLTELSHKNGDDFSDIPIIIADVNDEESLKKMASRAKVIINTCGPYRFYGEPVVKACLEAGTHHVDVSGEPQYMERMQLQYHKDAMEKGIYIVSACGFDSIPADLGICFLQEKFEGTLNSVETYLQGAEVGGPRPGPAINYATWESAVHGFAYANELGQLRRKLYPNRLPSFNPKFKQRSSVHKNEVINTWAIPFPGSDKSVVTRSQRFFYENEKRRPIQMHAYFGLDSVMSVISIVMLGSIFALLANFKFGRNLLLKYPRFFSMGFFSHENPSEEKVANTNFSITMIGEGWSETLANPDDQYTTLPNKRIIGKVSGTNPGYGATVIALTISAITILEEHKKMPNNGGVYPPGAAFAKTSMVEQLNKNGLIFEIVSTGDFKSSL